MKLAAKLLVVLAVAGCSANEASDEAPAIGVRLNAVVSDDGRVTTAAFGPEGKAADLLTIASGARPTDFEWIAVRLPTATNSDTEAVIDLSSADANASFIQVYASPCNPAKENYSTCRVLEEYSSGEPGLSGTMRLRVEEDIATASFNVTWEGDTDRFGEPRQWLRHETETGVQAAIVEQTP